MAQARKPVLTNLELEVMQGVWSHGQSSLTVREVVDGLNRGRAKELAYNTVQTILTILRDKGVVVDSKGPGRAHSWRARVSRDEVQTTMVGDLVERLFEGQVQPLLMQLVENEGLERAELEELRRLIDRELDDSDPEVEA